MKTARPILLAAVLILLGAWIAVPAWSQARPEAGFITLEENTFYFHLGSYFHRVALRSSPARIWYVYQPADENPESKPLFVFFNGGPGGATSSGLFSANTGRTAVLRDETTGAASIVTNPASWTRIGNLLHIDSRTAGFSYSLTDSPGDEGRRWGEFDAQNYNPYTDGADFVRFLIRFLVRHPAIRGNRVVLVPESYGGIRTIVMLHLLLYYENYAGGLSVYQNPGLVGEIRAHYNAVFPGYAGQTVPPAVVAGQFGHQILIQSALAWPYQRALQVEMLEAPGSVLDEIALETGVPYIRYRQQPGASQNPTTTQLLNYIYAYLDVVGRDAYICFKPSGYFNGHRQAAVGFLTQLHTLNGMTGVDVSGIGEMYASARTQAYKIKLLENSWTGAKRPITSLSGGVQRPPGNLDLSSLIGPPPRPKELLSWLAPIAEDSLAKTFGGLQLWDRYFIDLNYDISDAFSMNRLTLREYDIHHQSSLLYGQMFLENAAWVETFATDAAGDLVVFTPALPGALGRYTAILSGAEHDRAGPPGAARPGQIRLTYRPSSVPESTVAMRTIRFPRYLMSGHAVTLTQPADILEDVIDWLEGTGIPVRARFRSPR